MSVENFITRYVYKYKEISLKGLGTISLEDALPDNDYINKHKIVPIAHLHFVHQPSVATTPAFISFYAEMRGKIASLAENDVDAYMSMMLQFLNIGNPIEIKGLGTINKQKDGKLLMTPSHFLALKEEDAVNRFRDRQPEEEENVNTNFFGERKQQLAPIAKILMVAGITLAVALAGWWLYASFLSGPANTVTATGYDTLKTQQVIAAPVAPIALPDSPVVSSNTTVDSTKLLTWKAIIREESSKEKALVAWESTYKKLNSRVVMETSDSIQFKFYVVLPASLKDLKYKRDSVARFFARSVRIEPLQ